MKAYFTRRRILMLLAYVILTAFLALILRDFVREYIVLPLLNMAWVAWIGLLSVPQAVFWGIFLFLALIIALRSLSSGTTRSRDRFERAVQRYDSPSRYGYWQTGLKSITRSTYAHERVERELQNLVMQILAEQRHVGFEELREKMFQDTLDLTTEAPVIQDLFKHNPHTLWTSPPRGLAAWLGRLFGRSAPHVTHRLDMPAMVAWLEEQTGSLPEQIDASLQSGSDLQKTRSGS